MPFFSKLGFECPEAKGDADFLQDVTIQKGQQQFRKDQSIKHDYMTVSVRNTHLTSLMQMQLLCNDIICSCLHSEFITGCMTQTAYISMTGFVVTASYQTWHKSGL